MSSIMELEIWGGDWGLPSIDIDCLQLLVFGKFSGAPIKAKIVNNPFRRILPTFHHGTAFTCNTLEDLSAYLRGRNLNVDISLSSKQRSEIQAYRQLLKEKLYPGLQYTWWVDEKNYTELTRPWYAKALPFPFNYYYPGAYERRARQFICTVYGCVEEDFRQIETQVYGEAEKCLTLLSNRLGDSNYFYGSHPTSLDALIYSYLASLLKAPFPRAVLQNHLKACTNLVKFVDRISLKFFPGLSQEYEKKMKETTKAPEDESEFPHKRRNQFLAFMFAFIAMTGYGLSTGLLSVTLDDMEDDSPDMIIIEDHDGPDDD